MTQPRYELKRIGLFSAIKTLFLLGGLGGFLLGLVQWAALWVMYGVIRGMPETGAFPRAFELEMLLGSIGGAGGIIFPVSGGFIGSIVGVIAAVLLGGLYNLAARMWGGLEFEWEEVKSSTVAMAPVQAPAKPGEATPLPSAAQSVDPPGATGPSQPDAESETRPDDDDDDNGESYKRPSSPRYE